MTTLPHPQSLPPAIQTRQQFDAVVENIVQLQQQRADLKSEMENEIAAVRQKYLHALTEVERYLVLEMSWAEAWARNNPAVFGEESVLHAPHATIGFRAFPARVEKASRRWNWTDIVQKLAETPWGPRYLHAPAAEVDKDALLADRDKFSSEELRTVGIKIFEQERFFVAANEMAEAASP